MRKTASLGGIAAGMGAGAALMYFFDPDRGARRRALVRDKFIWASRKLSRAATVARRDLGNRAYGLVMEAKHGLKSNEAPDAVIEARVRSKLGRKVSNPHAIHVMCQDGNVTLSGQVLAGELPGLLRCVKTVPGVHSVESSLQVMHDRVQL